MHRRAASYSEQERDGELVGAVGKHLDHDGKLGEGVGKQMEEHDGAAGLGRRRVGKHLDHDGKIRHRMPAAGKIRRALATNADRKSVV